MTNEQSFQTFVDLSAALTGFASDVINPPLDPQALAQQYYNTLIANISAALVNQLLTTFQSIETASGGDPQKEAAMIEQQIMQNADIGPVARRIIRMWYLATWYTTEPPDPNGDGQVISMNAYTRGLAWTAFEAHPMGYSEMHYGYWADPPVTN